ncbi:MAG: type II toxin-antitoxin system VapC family toxin [Gammaproteobacteria bacterium]|nr:type II toxin-antitoxin system VapC family toxin [Gammaproteobacteria bacterium]
MKFLIDTNVISEQFKPELNENVNDWLNSINPLHAYLSILTVGEINAAIMKLSGKRKVNFQARLEEIIEAFEGRILCIDLKVIKQWAQLKTESEKKGRTLPVIDSLTAATALAYDLKLVTRNVKDFKGLVDYINPFE